MSRTALGLALVAVVPLVLGCGAAGKEDDVATGCDPGWHACGAGPDDCAPDTSPLTCGTRCTPCPAPANAVATCVAGACGFACDAGTHACSGACVDDASPLSCGPGCVACPPVSQAHARPACIAGACGYTCDLGWLRCASGCCEAPRAAFPRLACGGTHTCAVTASGGASCWGGNGSGQLGIGTTSESHVPAPLTIPAGTSAVQVAAGWAHSCGVAADAVGGIGVCWGDDWASQLGDGKVGTHSAVPVELDLGGGSPLMTAAGWAHSCALLGGGAVRCWGNGDYSQVGIGPMVGAGFPAPVALGSEAYAVLAGWGFTCAVTGPASMSCWGDNAFGQLGDPALDTGTDAGYPVPVANVAGVAALRAVALGQNFACVAYDGGTAAGAVRCWGQGDSGQLGNGATPAVQQAPVEVLLADGTPLLDVVALAAGGAHACAVTRAGALKCWGANSRGQLGVAAGDTTPRSRAADVSGLSSGVSGVAAGIGHTCALTGAGTAGEKLWCWGQNDHGQVGDGSTTDRTVPAWITGF